MKYNDIIDKSKMTDSAKEITKFSLRKFSHMYGTTFFGIYTPEGKINAIDSIIMIQRGKFSEEQRLCENFDVDNSKIAWLNFLFDVGTEFFDYKKTLEKLSDALKYRMSNLKDALRIIENFNNDARNIFNIPMLNCTYINNNFDSSDIEKIDENGSSFSNEKPISCKKTKNEPKYVININMS